MKTFTWEDFAARKPRNPDENATRFGRRRTSARPEAACVAMSAATLPGRRQRRRCGIPADRASNPPFFAKEILVEILDSRERVNHFSRWRTTADIRRPRRPAARRRCTEKTRAVVGKKYFPHTYEKTFYIRRSMIRASAPSVRGAPAGEDAPPHASERRCPTSTRRGGSPERSGNLECITLLFFLSVLQQPNTSGRH